MAQRDIWALRGDTETCSSAGTFGAHPRKWFETPHNRVRSGREPSKLVFGHFGTPPIFQKHFWAQDPRQIFILQICSSGRDGKFMWSQGKGSEFESWLENFFVFSSDGAEASTNRTRGHPACPTNGMDHKCQCGLRHCWRRAGTSHARPAPGGNP